MGGLRAKAASRRASSISLQGEGTALARTINAATGRGDGMNWHKLFYIAAGVAFLMAAPVRAETANVKYRGPVDLAPFECETITRSSFIERVCYDAANTYMLINLKGVWYHYCEIDKDTVNALREAKSMGHYYNAAIKGRFDCRTHRVPAY